MTVALTSAEVRGEMGSRLGVSEWEGWDAALCVVLSPPCGMWGVFGWPSLCFVFQFLIFVIKIFLIFWSVSIETLGNHCSIRLILVEDVAQFNCFSDSGTSQIPRGMVTHPKLAILEGAALCLLLEAGAFPSGYSMGQGKSIPSSE